MKLYVIGRNGEIKNAGQKKSRYDKGGTGFSLLRDEIMMLASIESRLAVAEPIEAVEEDELLAERCA